MAVEYILVAGGRLVVVPDEHDKGFTHHLEVIFVLKL